MRLIKVTWISSPQGSFGIVISRSGGENKAYIGMYNANASEEESTVYIRDTGLRLRRSQLEDILKNLHD